MNFAPSPSASPSPAWLPCGLCGAGIRDRELGPDEELHCGRCASVVKGAPRERSPQVPLALALTGVLLAALANAFPILTFDVAGNAQSNHIVTGVVALGDQGYWPVAALVFFCATAAPFLYFLAVGYVALAACWRRRLPGVRGVAHAAEGLESWSLAPVFAVACVVAVVKLDLLGTVYWQAGIGWIALLALCSLALGQVFDRSAAEALLEEAR